MQDAAGQGVGRSVVIDRAGLDAVFAALAQSGHRVVGPTVRDGAVVHDEVASVADLPEGWTDHTAGGTYRLAPRQDDALFGWAVGPQSPKRFLFPPREHQFTARRSDDGFVVDLPGTGDEPPLALVGVRPCELRAIEVQDRVLVEGAHPDRAYVRRRQEAFVLVAHCGDPSATCFCTSMGGGPRAGSGFDLALTEVLDGDRHEFVVEIGSDRGAAVLAAVPSRPAGDDDQAVARAVTDEAAGRMGRTMPTEGLSAMLAERLEHPRWDDVASRCLDCGNCTMVCPTCFCTATEEVTDLAGTTHERWRRWDSCFTLDFSYLHGGSARTTTRARYRQWLTHKLGTWHDQFGESGCVGCGRCIAWCPVGIDLTEEVAALWGTAAAPTPTGGEQTDALDP